MYDISKLKTPEECRTVMERAKGRGMAEVYESVFKRYCELSASAADDPNDKLVLEFEKVLAAYEQLLTEKNGRTTKASRTRQKMARHGTVQCLIDWALADNETEGFKLLVSAGLEEFTAEHLVVKFADRFSNEVVTAAKRRLSEHGLAF